jgi:predicted deacylase
VVIGTEKIKPGEVKIIEAEIARLPSRSIVTVPIVVSRSKVEGPVLLLMGGLHGDEINGIEIVKRILNKKIHLVKKGTFICIPLLNIFGFISFSRELPDGKDINRLFPGSSNGSLAARLANYLMKNIVPLIDYGIDFHTGGASRTNYPQIRCIINEKFDNDLAKAFSAPFTINSKYRRKSFRYVAKKMGKEILIYEGGESLRFDEFAISEGINGTMRVMKYLGMIESAPNPLTPNVVIQHTSWIRAKYSGILQTLVKYGDVVTKGTVLGIISDTLGETIHKIRSPWEGHIIALNYNPVIHQGDALFHIGQIDKKTKSSAAKQ